MLTLLLAALAVSLGNFAVALGIGSRGASRRLRLHVVVAFGLFEALMPVLGLALGRPLATAIGSAANPMGGAVLCALGVNNLVAHRRAANPDAQLSFAAQLVPLAAVLSIDNLIVGFSIAAQHVAILATAATMACASVLTTVAAMELGRRATVRFDRGAERAGGAVLVVVGLAIAAGAI